MTDPAIPPSQPPSLPPEAGVPVGREVGNPVVPPGPSTSSLAPRGAPPEAPRPKNRAWFVVLAWVTLIGFGIFVLGITAVTVAIPELKKAKEASR